MIMLLCNMNGRPQFALNANLFALPRRPPSSFFPPKGTSFNQKARPSPRFLIMAPQARFELATLRLTAGCSTAELLRNIQLCSFALLPKSCFTKKRLPRYYMQKVFGCQSIYTNYRTAFTFLTCADNLRRKKNH